jgi:hypothetical protein
MELHLVKILIILYLLAGYNEHPDTVTARSIKTYKPDGTTLQPTLASGKQAINSIENTWLKYEATFKVLHQLL